MPSPSPPNGIMFRYLCARRQLTPCCQVKTLGIVRGTFTVHPDLPSHLQQGIFQPGSTYSAIARYANEPSFLLPDNTNAPRGLGLKLFDVPGERLDPTDGVKTQDFLFNNSPSVELTDIPTTLEIFDLRTKYFDDQTRLKVELAKRSDRVKQFAPGMLPNEYVIAATMYTQCECYLPLAASCSSGAKGARSARCCTSSVNTGASHSGRAAQCGDSICKS